ncbi:MAG: BamA/TamA family outer membrane protein [Candidatus Zixiibacteriota bacterium]
MKIYFRGIFVAVVFCLILPAALLSIEYKEFKHSKQQNVYFEITYSKKDIKIKTIDKNEPNILIIPRNSINITDGIVYSDGTILFDKEGLIYNNNHFYYDNITDTRIIDNDKYITITFMTTNSGQSKSSRFKKGNLITANDKIIIEKNDFIRGILFSVTGNIEVYGEVNKDIISLFGDVNIKSSAVARGDIASITGKIDVAREASVYGEIYFTPQKGIKRKHRYTRNKNYFSISGSFKYNRVDGLACYTGIKFKDSDSLLPTVWGNIGYGFNSKRGRYDFGMEQTLFHSPIIIAGGSLFRKLASGDDWLLDNNENLVFTLLVTEDFKDYYEAEGGTGYLKFIPQPNLLFESHYYMEETKWLEANRHLWSLFGGDKLFNDNFGWVDDNFRNPSIEEIDSTTNAYWYNKIDWDTRPDGNFFDKSSWHITADWEWSHNNLKSDFTYHRYTINVRRYQQVNKWAMIIIRGMYAGSDGYLPMYKRFYLGGLGTLRGYKHKEFMGTKFWMVNSEYRINPPGNNKAVSIFWDIAQIANDSKLDSNVEIKNNLGIALYFGDSFKISLAKRLDRSFDDNPKIYVRLKHIL